jgi:replicative DNA helicase
MDYNAKTKKSGAPVNSEKLIDRAQPHSIDMEQALIACCIMEGGQETVPLCLESKITAASFYLPAHRLLWEALVSIYDEGSPIDEMFLADKLRASGKFDAIGGIDYINRVCDRIDVPTHVAHYIKRVRDLELVRRVISVSMASIERAYGETDDLEDFIERTENEIFAISSDRVSDCAAQISRSIDAAAAKIQLMASKRELTGVASGFIDLDKITFGFRPSEMIVVAARPSIGKTSFAMNIAENVVLPKKGHAATGVLFFSLEMSSEELAMRLLCGRAGINKKKLQDGFVSKASGEIIAATAKEIKSSKLWIDESTNLTIVEMRAKARRMCSREKIGLIIVDYLQLMSGDNRINREQQIADISRGMKVMAKELKIPVIVLSQLNRESEREKRQPKLSDLRESGAIEQDADMVLLLSKEISSKESFGEDPEETEFNSDSVVRDLIVAKNRNGPIGVVRLAFVRSLTRFENYICEKLCE